MTLGNANYQFKDYPSLPLPEERRFESIKISLELPASKYLQYIAARIFIEFYIKQENNSLWKQK